MLRRLLSSETAGGFLLILAAASALAVANSPVAPAYHAALAHHLGPLSVLHWINDALMALFFLLVGLEIKRELIAGRLRSWSDRALPGIAAAGGVIAPALVYILVNRHSPATLAGWAIPAATDIAFALAVLSLVGGRVPASLKLFLATLAILDDLAAILIISLFYAGTLAVWPLLGAAAVLAALVALNRYRIGALTPYLLLGVLLWLLVLKSGVHATLAGVLLAATIPIDRDPARSPLHRLEHQLAPWVGLLVVPLFGLANAGVALPSGGLGNPVTLGIAAGLLLGKPIGVCAAAWAAIRLRLATLPRDVGWGSFAGVAMLCGIGFTMSLFIGLLAFPSTALQDEVKLGVLAGSLLSGLAGWIVLRLTRSRPSPG